jgi:lipoyl(octanoyl) transferase
MTDFFVMQYIWRGLLEYEIAHQQQLEFLTSTAEEVWGLEHPKVITLGLSAEDNSEVHKEFLEQTKILRVDRGGKATLHNEGQLIIYPQFFLKKYGFGVRTYVDSLLGVTRKLLIQLDVPLVISNPEVGLFTPNGKIASIGIRVQKDKVYHGLSINVCNALADFDAIRSCGIWNRPQDQLKNWGVQLGSRDVFWLWVEIWKTELQKLQDPQTHQTPQNF